MTKKINIIGAGLGGLCAGVYLQQAGYETEIFELAPWAGGVFTSWVRGGYRFDGCIHWMVGTRAGDPFNDLYREVGLLEADTPIYSADTIKLEIGGVMYEVPMTFEKFRAFLLALSPQDSALTGELCGDIHQMMGIAMPATYPSGLFETLGFLRRNGTFIKLMQKYLGRTIGDYAKGFKSETIRAILNILLPPEFSVETLVMMLSTRMSGNAGYPMGGSLAALGRIEAKYRSLGGKLRLNTRVDEIVVENGRAVGVRANGALYPAQGVVAACDVYDTLRNMLAAKYRHGQLETMLEEFPLFEPELLVSYGLKKRFDIPYSMHLEYQRGIETASGNVKRCFSIRSFDFDPSAAPENGSSVIAALNAPLDYWQELRGSDPAAYKARKQALADAVTAALEERFPGFKDSIEVTDVATPATYVRLTNLYKASFEGFEPTPAALKARIRKTIPGVKNLVLCGQWLSGGGGICSTVSGGKEAAQLIGRAVK